MRILVLAGSYPSPSRPLTGIFNEKCVGALKELCGGVEVIVPRPYVPGFLTFVPRWKAYASVPGYELRNHVPVYRPATPVIPKVGAALWNDLMPFVRCRPVAQGRHYQTKFDAILSFDLGESAGIAWRMGRALGIPASGWAFGEDVRFPPRSPLGRVVAKAINELDLIFYQSDELVEKAAQLVGVPKGRLPSSRHKVLPHGIPDPPIFCKSEIRNRLRSTWGIGEKQILVVSIGRIYKQKGIFELLEAFSFATMQNPNLTCMMIGSDVAFDDTVVFQRAMDQTPSVKGKMRLLPVCRPDDVWEYLCAADIFAFTSHREGMPNALLEAMAMEVPAVAFGIPPVQEIDGGSEALTAVPPFNTVAFSEAILRLAAQPQYRSYIGKKGRERIAANFSLKKNMAVAVESLNNLINKH